MHTVWVDPELLLEHQGVRVFQTYREDDYGQGARDYWFTANSLCGELDRLCDDQPCRHVFDVRGLSTWKARGGPASATPSPVGTSSACGSCPRGRRESSRRIVSASTTRRKITPRGSAIGNQNRQPFGPPSRQQLNRES